MLTLFAILAVVIIIIFAAFFGLSPGTVRQIKDEYGLVQAGSIAEKGWLDINGTELGVFIKGRSTENPVLLFLHGGPGIPEYSLLQKYPTGLEDIFTVCWLEQRGTGLSYTPGMGIENLSTDQIIADTLAVAEYLADRFDKEKVYLMGHSWGSFIGIQAAECAPELFHAYMGIGQIAKQGDSEKEALEYMIKFFDAAEDKKMVTALRKIDPKTLEKKWPRDYIMLRDKAMHRAGVGTTHEMKSVISGIVLPVMENTEYTMDEKINIWRGKMFLTRSSTLVEDLFESDLNVDVSELQIPAYFFHGKYDFTASYSIAKSYFDGLKAPKKQFYTFEKSAHSPLLEEPEKMRRILIEDILWQN